MYDNWWNGGNRTTPQRHNIVAVLTEAASVRLATPIFLERNDLSGGSRGFRNHALAVNFGDPWPGGWWRLRDIVDYELICARSLLTLASRYRQQFQANLRAMGRDAVARGENSPPYAWIVPRDQRDPGTAVVMLQRLHATGIEVRLAKSSFQAEGATYPEGTWILPAAQPYRAHLKDMMERQVYPARFNARGEAESPYDVAGWTLPLQMGVRTVAVSEPLTVESELLNRIKPIVGKITGDEAPEWFSLRDQSNDDFIVVNALLEGGVKVDRLLEGGVTVDRRTEGGFRFAAHDKARAILDRVLPRVSSQVLGHKGPHPAELEPHTLHPARVGLYQPWVPSMDEGWTRYVLEQFHFPYATLHNSEVRAGNLAERYDVIVIPSIPARVLRDGYAANQTEPAYVGGLGTEGVASLRAFVEAGGTLVCLEDSCEYAINELGLPVTSLLKSLKSSQFYGPGSIVRLERQRVLPFSDEALLPTVGAAPEVSAYFDHSLAFEAKGKAGETIEVRFPLRYARTQPLESGWLLGPEHLAGKAALAVVRRGGGRVILFGFPPQHRGQPHGTFRLLFNTLYVERP
jgi:hypothetical protein